jgi:type VI secretion system protein ImpM
MQTMSGAPELSLFGKLPCRPDFVRVRCHGPAANELDQFVVRAAEQLNAQKLSLRGTAVRYLYCVPAAQRVLLGVLGESRDQVGREFPLALFASVPLARCGGRLARLALGFADFFARAEHALREIAAAPFEQIDARLDAFALPDADVLDEAEVRLAGRLASSPALAFVEHAFGPADSALHCYGLLTLITAAKPVRDAPPGQLGTVLDCPAHDDNDRLIFMELATRVLRWRDALPTCCWTAGPMPARLLIALGPPPSDVLRALADPGYSSQRIWPLTTARVAAIERARAALPELARLAEEPSMSAERLVSLVATAAEAP